MEIVGNSIGGSRAIEVARLVPERVRMIVLVGTKPGTIGLRSSRRTEIRRSLNGRER
jgi:pimeloyl-ACP methyl ester carboxylesterase